jgi:WD40 repeat protein
LWDVKAGKQIRLLPKPNDELALAFSPDSKILAAAGADSTICLWVPEQGTEILSLPANQGHIMALAYSPDGKTLASAGKTGRFGSGK